MIAVLLAVAVGLAWWLTRTLAVRLSAMSPLTARNYRGLEIPAATGMAVVLGMVLSCAVMVALARLDQPEHVAGTTIAALLCGAAAAGYGLLGLWDDLMPPHERGWSAHVRALRAMRPTGGAVKLAGGAALGLLLAAAAGGPLWAIALRGALIAMSANLVNLFDLRPGRAIKFSTILGAVVLIAALIAGDRVAIPLGAALAAGAAFLPLDLGERAMLGDVGANALGAVLGVATVAVANTPAEIVIVVALAGMHLLADRPGLSRLIAATPPLAALDRVGRAPAAD